MAKEKTILINMRIPESLLKDFDEEVNRNNMVTSRTGLVLQLMGEHIGKSKRKRIAEDKK